MWVVYVVPKLFFGEKHNVPPLKYISLIETTSENILETIKLFLLTY